MTESLPADLRAELVNRVALMLCGGSTWAWNEATDQTKEFWRKQARTAFDAIAPRLSEHAAGQVREHIAAEIREFAELHLFDGDHDQPCQGYAEAFALADRVARSSRPVVTESGQA